MNLNEYVPLAVKTESRIPYVTFDKVQLSHLLNVAIDVTELLDAVKKNVFYGKPINVEDWHKYWSQLQTVASEQMFVNPNDFPREIPLGILNPRLFHCAVGIFTEAGELFSALIKGQLDLVNFREELGDIEWYQAIGYDELGSSAEDNLQNNIDKLKKRYADKFTSKAAIERDIDAEREVLQSGQNMQDNE